MIGRPRYEMLRWKRVCSPCIGSFATPFRAGGLMTDGTGSDGNRRQIYGQAAEEPAGNPENTATSATMRAIMESRFAATDGAQTAHGTPLEKQKKPPKLYWQILMYLLYYQPTCFVKSFSCFLPVCTKDFQQKTAISFDVAVESVLFQGLAPVQSRMPVYILGGCMWGAISLIPASCFRAARRLTLTSYATLLSAVPSGSCF